MVQWSKRPHAGHAGHLGDLGRAEFAHIVERFSMLPIEHCTITKLDECAARGRLLACLRRHRLPVRYGCTGQEVPADIHGADAALFTAGLTQDSQPTPTVTALTA